MTTIGIIYRIDKTENNDVYIFNKILVDYFINKEIKIIPLLSYDIEFIKKCDGFILSGGDNRTIDFLIIKYAYENNIPLLGICLGMQSIGEYFGGTLENKDKHYSKDKYAHNIIVKKNSNLYNILGKQSIKVNSRHKQKVTNTNINIVAFSEDAVIEAIEDKTKKFFIGVQWHPESMISYDDTQKKLLDRFIKSCKGEIM